MDKQHPQQQWQQAVIAYAQAVNDYVAQGRAHGWDNLEEPQAPATEPVYYTHLTLPTIYSV